MLSTFALSFVAGCLTSLSPCVLPALPILIGSAAQEHKHAPLFLAFGMIASFSLLGFIVAAFGSELGLHPTSVRRVGAVLLVFCGVLLLSTKLQEVLAKLFSPLANRTTQIASHTRLQGLAGQFVVGALLGAIWSPCVGPTLGAAFGLAAQGSDLGQVAVTMLIFAVGAAVPLLFIAYGSRNLFLSNRSRLTKLSAYAKKGLAIVLMVVGAAVLMGVDKLIETSLLNVLPDWWLRLTTSI